MSNRANKKGIDLGVTPTFMMELNRKEEGGRMKTVIITEGIKIIKKDVFVIDIEASPVKRCTGCWKCWLKTPGRCAYKDLDPFYYQYIQADYAIYMVKVEKGFVSSKLKALFERLSPLYLPYIAMGDESTMHVPRYPHYPKVSFYYKGEFISEQERNVFEGYIRRTFKQFYSPLIEIRSLEQLHHGREVAHL